MGFFKCLLALIHVNDPFDPLLPLQKRSNAHRIHSVLAAVDGREANLHGYGTLHGVEMVRGSVVYLAFVVINPSVVAKRVNEWSAVAIRESDVPRKRGAVRIACQSLQHLLHIVYANHVIVVHEGDILTRRLGEQHAPLLTDAQLAIVREVKNLNRLVANLFVQINSEVVQQVLAFVQRGNQD